MLKDQKGFTLLEALLSIVLISILTVIAMPVFYSLIPRNDLDVAKNQVVQSLRRAEILSLASDGDTTWGLKILSGSIVIFKGASYAARIVSYDEVYEISSTVIPSGLTEVVFNKLTGIPTATGITTLTSTNGETRSVTINAKGMVSY